MKRNHLRETEIVLIGHPGEHMPITIKNAKWAVPVRVSRSRNPLGYKEPGWISIPEHWTQQEIGPAGIATIRESYIRQKKEGKPTLITTLDTRIKPFQLLKLIARKIHQPPPYLLR
jgi:hypothetical protein